MGPVAVAVVGAVIMASGLGVHVRISGRRGPGWATVGVGLIVVVVGARWGIVRPATSTANAGGHVAGDSPGGSGTSNGAGQAVAPPKPTAKTPRLLYRDTVLTFSAVPDCAAGNTIELDSPKIQAEVGDSALSFHCEDNSLLGLSDDFSLSTVGGVAKMALANGAADPVACQKAIDVSATDKFDLKDAVAGQTAFCVSDPQGDIALVKVVGIGSVHDGKLTLSVTAWH